MCIQVFALNVGTARSPMEWSSGDVWSAPGVVFINSVPHITRPCSCIRKNPTDEDDGNAVGHFSGTTEMLSRLLWYESFKGTVDLTVYGGFDCVIRDFIDALYTCSCSISSRYLRVYTLSQIVSYQSVKFSIPCLFYRVFFLSAYIVLPSMAKYRNLQKEFLPRIKSRICIFLKKKKKNKNFAELFSRK